MTNNQTIVRNLLIEAREVLMEIDKHYKITAFDPGYIMGTHDIEIAKMLQLELLKESEEE